MGTQEEAASPLLSGSLGTPTTKASAPQKSLHANSWALGEGQIFRLQTERQGERELVFSERHTVLSKGEISMENKDCTCLTLQGNFRTKIAMLPFMCTLKSQTSLILFLTPNVNEKQKLMNWIASEAGGGDDTSKVLS